MKVSELKRAAEEFLLENGDQEVKLLWEAGVFTEGFDARRYDDPTDVRSVADWPLPGKSILFQNESSEMSNVFVIMYGESETPAWPK